MAIFPLKMRLESRRLFCHFRKTRSILWVHLGSSFVLTKCHTEDGDTGGSPSPRSAHQHWHLCGPWCPKALSRPEVVEPGRGPCSEPTQGQASGSRNLQNDLVTFRRGVWSQEERGGHCPVLVLLLWAIRAGGGGYRPQIPLRYPTAGQDDPRSLHTASSLRPEARSAGRTGRPVTYPCSPAFRLFH